MQFAGGNHVDTFSLEDKQHFVATLQHVGLCFAFNRLAGDVRRCLSAFAVAV